MGPMTNIPSFASQGNWCFLALTASKNDVERLPPKELKSVRDKLCRSGMAERSKPTSSKPQTLSTSSLAQTHTVNVCFVMWTLSWPPGTKRERLNDDLHINFESKYLAQTHPKLLLSAQADPPPARMQKPQPKPMTSWQARVAGVTR